MKKSLPDDFYFSQHALNLFKQCPLKFRFRYLDGFFWPGSWGQTAESQKLIDQGKKFHKLANRYYSRGWIPEKTGKNKQLVKWFSRLTNFCPYQEQGSYKPEYELRLNVMELKLMAKYDLIFIDHSRSHLIIYDWKTGKRPPEYKKMSGNLQTSVYLLVMARAVNEYFVQAGDITLDSLKLCYWNPRHPKRDINIDYNMKRYSRDKEKISNLISQIREYSYEDFKINKKQKKCTDCRFQAVCGPRKNS